MTINLSQYAGGSAPQLPGATVLRVNSADDPAVVMHDTGATQNQFYCRFMFNASDASGGSLALAGGIDAEGLAAWQLWLDTSAGSVTLVVGDESLVATYAEPIDWHSVEVGLDALVGAISFRIDGIEREMRSTPLSPGRYAWLGGVFRDSGLLGVVDLDHWVLAAEPIGVARAAAQHDHGGDPRRWLVIYNRNLPDSARWADTYRARCNVPYTNLCGLDLPASETLDATAYGLMLQQLGDYLDDNNLREQIVGVLLGFGVPGYADLNGLGSVHPISALLHTDSVLSQASVNPLYQDVAAQRPASGDFVGIRLTGRIDAATLQGAIDLLDRAVSLSDLPLSHDHLSELVIDTNPDNPDVGPVYTDLVDEWASGSGLAKLRLPTRLYDEAGPVSVSNEAVFWGWRDAAPPAGLFDEPAGRRALCLQFDPQPIPSTSLRSSGGTDWLSTAIAAGYAAVAAPSRDYSLSSMPLPNQFFDALRQGWTLAEAWLVAQPFMRDGLQLVGDPLMTIAFPKAGYDVFGPVDRSDLFDLDQPFARLNAGERSFQLSGEEIPSPGLPARYWVRRLDHEGRSDHASSVAFAAREQGQVIRPALPAWPRADGWRVARRSNRLVLSVVWAASAQALDIDAVQLYSQTDSEDPRLVRESTFKSQQRDVAFLIDLPSESIRYRFRVLQGAFAFDSPWSQWVVPASASQDTLTLLESQP